MLLKCRFCSSHKLPGDVDTALKSTTVLEDLACDVHDLEPKSLIFELPFRKTQTGKILQHLHFQTHQGPSALWPLPPKQRLSPKNYSISTRAPFHIQIWPFYLGGDRVRRWQLQIGHIIFMTPIICVYLFIWFIYLVALGLSCVAGSLVAAHRLLSCGMQTLSCSMHVGSSSLSRIEPGAPELGAQSLNHSATREVPCLFILKKLLKVCVCCIAGDVIKIQTVLWGHGYRRRR